jgi:hypothetical protein
VPLALELTISRRLVSSVLKPNISGSSTRDMTSSSIPSIKSSRHKPTPASLKMEKETKAESVSDAMQQEEERMKAQREKNDAKRDAQLEKERQEDIKSGRDILDKKFQQLEFLMNKSKVSIAQVTTKRGID